MDLWWYYVKTFACGVKFNLFALHCKYLISFGVCKIADMIGKSQKRFYSFLLVRHVCIFFVFLYSNEIFNTKFIFLPIYFTL